MTLPRCPHYRNPLASGTVHHLRARGPSVIICRVIDVEENLAGLVGR